jgi:uncharacterized protein
MVDATINQSRWQLVGRVLELHRYPVKSMAGESLEEAQLGWHGLAGDRRYAFVRLDSRSGLPWLSARDFPGLLCYRAHYRGGEDLGRSQPIVMTPDGAALPFWDDLLWGKLTADAGHPLQAVQLWRGAYDAMDVSLITTGSLRTISAAVGIRLESARFRPNILIEATATRDFPEEKWVGRILGFGERPDDIRVLVARKDERCAIVNFDPATAASDPRILREIVRMRRNLLGAYGLVQRPGVVRAGDSVWLRRS